MVARRRRQGIPSLDTLGDPERERLELVEQRVNRGAPLGPPGRGRCRREAEGVDRKDRRARQVRKQLRDVTEERDIPARAVAFFTKGTR
jgi:hypothetical protein